MNMTKIRTTEIMKLLPGSRIEPGVEIWYKGERRFWFDGEGTYVVGTPIADVPESAGLPLSLVVPIKEEADAEA